MKGRIVLGLLTAACLTLSCTAQWKACKLDSLCLGQYDICISELKGATRNPACFGWISAAATQNVPLVLEDLFACAGAPVTSCFQFLGTLASEPTIVKAVDAAAETVPTPKDMLGGKHKIRIKGYHEK